MNGSRRHRLLIRISTGLFACLLLSGCFDVHEELWVNRDGSGKAELTYVIPASAVFMLGGTEGVEEKIRSMISRQPPLSLDALEVKETEDGVRISGTVSAKSMLSLLDLKKGESSRELPAAALDIAGNFDVRLQGLDIDLTRTVKVREALGLMSLAVGKEEREKRRLVCILHLPMPPEESNAMTIEDGGKTLKWETTLGDALKKPLVTHVRARMPIPTAAWYAAALLVVALIALGRMIWKWRKRALQASAKPKTGPIP